MENFVEVGGRASKSLKTDAKNFALCCLAEKGYTQNFEIAIKFVSEDEIKSLNNNFRGVDKVTDVLSFPAVEAAAGIPFDAKSLECVGFERVHLGDIAVCLNKLKCQAKEFGVSEKEELEKLIIHSVLHLMGYDHFEDSDYEVMKAEEERLSEIIGCGDAAS